MAPEAAYQVIPIDIEFEPLSKLPVWYLCGSARGRVVLDSNVTKFGDGEANARGSRQSAGLPVAALLSQHEQIQAFDLFPCPRGFAQELEARCNARLVREAAHGDALAQFEPAEIVGQVGHHAFKGDAMQRIAWLGG